MKLFKKALVVALSMTMAMSMFVGCGDKTEVKDPNGQEQNQEAQGPKVLRLAESKVTTMNPHNFKTGAERDSMSYIFGTPIKIVMNKAGDGYELYPNHCEEIPTVDESGKIWTFKLREGLKFDDGTPINADTYVYSYKMLLDPKLLNEKSSTFYDSIPVVNAKKYWKGEAKWEDVGIKKVDELSFTIETETMIPAADFITEFRNVPTAPVHKDLYESNMNEAKDETKYGTSLDRMPKSSGGAYSITEWNRDMSRKYVKNADSPLADIYVPDEIVERVVENDETKLQLFENGEIDEILLLGAKYDNYQDDPRVKFAPAITSMQLILNKDNKENPMLANKDFREALFVGMDRETIGTAIYRTGKPANFLLTSAYISDFETGESYRQTEAGKSVADNHPTYNPEAAKAAFDKAYAANGNKQITLTLNYFDTNQNLKKISEFLEESYENLFGKDRFDVILEAIPWQVQYENMEKGNYQAGFGFFSDSAFSPWKFFASYKSNAPGKVDSFKNADFDKLLDRTLVGDLVNDKAKRLEALAQLESMLVDDYSVMPLIEVNIPLMYSDRIKINTKDGMYIPGLSYAIMQADIVDAE